MTALRLDELKLAENLEWQRRNFDRAVSRVRRVMEDFIATDISQALGMINYENPIGPMTHADAAANISGALVQAVSNADLRGLNDTAAEVAAATLALNALRELKANTPGLSELLDAAERERHETERRKIEDRDAAFMAKRARQCQVAVPFGGRMVGRRQCSNDAGGPKAGKFDYEGASYRCCGRHLKELRAGKPIQPIRLKPQRLAGMRGEES